MKIVVIGVTGLIGSKLIKKLRADGHDPLAASPDTGVDIITGKGLDEALAGAQVVVDVSNAPDWGDAAVMDFFQTSARNILAAETAGRRRRDHRARLRVRLRARARRYLQRAGREVPRQHARKWAPDR